MDSISTDDKDKEQPETSNSCVDQTYDCLGSPTAKNAYYLGLAGVILEGSFTFLGIFGYFWFGSALLLLYGIENFVDFVSSIVVLWRFYAPGELTKEREQVLSNREDRAAVAISFLIIIMGCLVIPAAVSDLRKGPPSEDDVDEGLEVIIIISFASIVIFSVMTVLKLHYARILNSESLHKDGLCSVIGIVLSSLIFIDSWIIHARPEWWQTDAYCAMACGILALLIGLHGIIKAIFIKQYNIFSWRFWSTGTSFNNSGVSMMEGDPTLAHNEEETEELKLSTEDDPADEQQEEEETDDLKLSSRI